MKKVLLVLSIMATAAIASAQVSFGVQGGGIVSGMSYKIQGGQAPTLSSRFGFKVGGVAEVPVAQSISFMPQLNFVNKGYKYTGNGVNVNSSLYYVEVPLNFTYNSSGFFVGAGPSIAFGLSGTTNVTQGTDKDKVTVKFDGKESGNDNNEHYKSLDFGGNLVAGYKLTNGVFFNVNYNFGLSNISTDKEVTSKNHYFGFGVGYFFNSK